MTDRRDPNQAPRRVESNQPGVHPRLQEVVRRHIASRWQQPIRPHNSETFDALSGELQSEQFIIDAGCGTGQSTIALAERYPDQLVLGIDRSANRLEREKGGLPSNLRYIRADLEDWWRLTESAGLVASRQTIFYPNPYPKAAQLQRRWHAHPVLPALLACGSNVEIRSNWETYIQEARIALQVHFPERDDLEVTQPVGEPITAFERKYGEAGQRLYQITLAKTA